MSKTPRAFVQKEAKKRAKRSALGAPVVLEGAKLTDYAKLTPLRIGEYEGPLTLQNLTKPKKPRS